MRLLLAAAVLAAALSAALAWQVQGWRWAAKAAAIEAAHAAAAQAAEQASRAKEQALQRGSERIARDTQEKQTRLVAAAAASQRAADQLRDEIARLGARPAPADPESAAFADEAGVARQLLGACAEEYRGMAQEADGLRVQVTGLQQFAKTVCQAGGQP
jgi:chromosome segregation ATPase